MTAKPFNMEMNIVKALGMLAIIAGHSRVGNIFGELVPIGSFHVAIFFFVAGYFFKKDILEIGNTFKNFLSYSYKVIKKWIPRFYAYHFFYGFMTGLVFLLMNKKFGHLPTFENLIIKPYEYIAFQFDVPLWFLYQLVVSLIVFSFVMVICKKIYKGKYSDYFPLHIF